METQPRRTKNAQLKEFGSSLVTSKCMWPARLRGEEGSWHRKFDRGGFVSLNRGISSKGAPGVYSDQLLWITNFGAVTAPVR